MSADGGMLAAVEAGQAGFEVTGLVKWFDPTKGYGFIKPSSGALEGDVLLHQTCVRQSGFKAAY
ncbi:MAG TPA: cold shock domain-containing protein [Rhizomicrobium sp.]